MTYNISKTFATAFFNKDFSGLTKKEKRQYNKFMFEHPQINDSCPTDNIDGTYYEICDIIDLFSDCFTIKTN